MHHAGVEALPTPSDNAAFLTEVLDGREGPALDLIALNAAATFYLCNTTETLEDGMTLAKDILLSGGALEILTKWKKYST